MHVINTCCACRDVTGRVEFALYELNTGPTDRSQLVVVKARTRTRTKRDVLRQPFSLTKHIDDVSDAVHVFSRNDNVKWCSTSLAARYIWRNGGLLRLVGRNKNRLRNDLRPVNMSGGHTYTLHTDRHVLRSLPLQPIRRVWNFYQQVLRTNPYNYT